MMWRGKRIGFAAELSLVIRGRIDPEAIIVLLKAYIDESGTHGSSPVTCMSGFLGTVRQWERFEETFQNLRKKYGFTVFHAKEFRHGQGEFRGWSAEKQDRFIADMAAAINIPGVGWSSFLSNAEYEAHYKGQTVSKGLRNSKYGICFRASLGFLLAQLETRFHGKPSDKLHLVLELGHRNVGEAQRLFMMVKRSLDQRGQPYLGTLALAGKRDCVPLAAADFMAYTTYLTEERGMRNPASRPLEGPKAKNLHRIEIGKKQLIELREQVLPKAMRR